MQVIFVHGWSVTHTDTYGGLPEALARSAAHYDLNFDIQHIWLGKYVSFHDATLGHSRAERDNVRRHLP